MFDQSMASSSKAFDLFERHEILEQRRETGLHRCRLLPQPLEGVEATHPLGDDDALVVEVGANDRGQDQVGEVDQRQSQNQTPQQLAACEAARTRRFDVVS